ncbi:MAG: TIR domain-containing protein, partial [Planctomycetota bacterium]
MSEIFISYAREDQEKANLLRAALENVGYSVWSDQDIPIGSRWAEAIEQQIEKAKCLIVLWSQASVGSDWIREEADVAAERGILIPALLEEVRIPFMFRRIQAANLTSWSGDEKAKEFIALIHAIEATLHGAIEVVQQSRSENAVKEYLSSLKDDQYTLNEVKILFVGDGGSGKTSLLKRLLGRPFSANEPQTHGINIEKEAITQGGSEIRMNLWDFGGQEIMHSTHQFFLSKRSLYILVLDGRKEEDPEYWLQHIQTFGGSSPIIVV